MGLLGTLRFRLIRTNAISGNLLVLDMPDKPAYTVLKLL